MIQEIGQCKQWMIFLACALVMCMVNLDLTSFNLVLATVSHEMDASMMTMQWIAAGYIISAASMMAFAGRLTEVLDNRRVFLLGLVIFILTSIAVACSTHEIELIVFRVLQGASVAFLLPASIALLRMIFPEKNQGFMVSLLIAIALLSQGLGSLYGSWMLENFSWRLIFWVNIPFSVLSLCIAYFTIPKSVLNERVKKKIQILSVILLVTSLFLFMHALNEVNQWGVSSPLLWLVLLMSALTMSAFVYLEKKAETPVIHLSLLRIKQFRDVCIIRFVLIFSYFSLLFILGLMLQNVFHYSHVASGQFLVLVTLLLGVISAFSGKYVDRVGVKKPLLFSLCLLILGLCVLLSFCYHESILWFLVSLLILGVSFSLAIPTSTSAGVLSIDVSSIGSTVGLMFTISSVGASLGIAVSGCLLHYFSKKTLGTLLNHSSYVFNAAQERMLYLAASGARNLNKTKALFDGHMMTTLHKMTKLSFMDAFVATIVVLLVLAIIALLMCMRMRFLKRS